MLKSDENLTNLHLYIQRFAKKCHLSHISLCLPFYGLLFRPKLMEILKVGEKKPSGDYLY